MAAAVDIPNMDRLRPYRWYVLILDVGILLYWVYALFAWAGLLENDNEGDNATDDDATDDDATDDDFYIVLRVISVYGMVASGLAIVCAALNKYKQLLYPQMIGFCLMLLLCLPSNSDDWKDMLMGIFGMALMCFFLVIHSVFYAILSKRNNEPLLSTTSEVMQATTVPPLFV